MRRRIARGFLVLVLAFVATIMTGTGSSAQFAGTFSVRARADSLGVQLAAAELPAFANASGEVLFLTPVSSQSEVNSLGASDAFAAAPYPGEVLVGLPNVVSGLFGGVSFPTPTYPFYVASSHPTTAVQEEELGPYVIHAESAERSSSSEARVGASTTTPELVSSVARTSVRFDDSSGHLIAEAEADIAPFAVSDVLRLGEIRSRARIVFDPETGAMVEKSSDLAIGSITIAGTELAIGDDGLELGGISLFPIDLGPILALLNQSGVTFEIVPEVETDTSVSSSSLRISYSTNIPNLGDTRVTIVLGRVEVAADGGAFGSSGDVTPSVPTPASTPFAPAATGAQPTARPSTPGAGLSSPASPAVPSTGSQSQPIATGPIQPIVVIPDLWAFYPALVVGALAALLTGRSGTWVGLRRRFPAARTASST